MEQHAKRKFNIIDVIVIVLLLAAVCFAGWKLAHRNTGGGDPVKVTYKIQCENVPNAVYESCLEHLPCQLMASGALLDGAIESVEKLPYRVLGPDGKWVEDPDHVTLLFTVWSMCPYEEVMTSKVGEQEIRIGKTKHILKSEYMEFQETVIVDVQWGE